MTILSINWTDIFDSINNVILWLLGGGAAALFAIFVKESSKIFSFLELLADHTETKKDNELVDQLKSWSQTFVKAVEPMTVPGNEQKDKAVSDLIEMAKKLGKDLSKEEAENLIEEAYQDNYGKNKQQALKDPKAQLEQKALLASVQADAAKVDADNPNSNAIAINDGDKISVDGKPFTFNVAKDGTISLTKEGK